MQAGSICGKATKHDLALPRRLIILLQVCCCVQRHIKNPDPEVGVHTEHAGKKKKQQKPQHAHRINLGSTLSSQSGLCPLLSRFELGLTLTWLKTSPQQQFIYIFMGTSDTSAATYEKAKGVQNAECNSERQRGPAVRQAAL